MSVKKKGKWSGIKKFGYAFRGIYTSLKEEASLVIHFIVAILVLIVAAILTSKAITPKPINLTD
jgi:diacylglycerol kinase